MVEAYLERDLPNPDGDGSRLSVTCRPVGGDMLPPTSPNDPVFYLNHCNVDRLWARWQNRRPSAGYRPASGPQALAGHRRNDAMFRPFWWSADDPVVRPADMLDVAARYTYDVL